MIFARKIAELSGMPYTESLLRNTDLYGIFGLKWPEELLLWQQFIAELPLDSLAIEEAYRFYSQRYSQGMISEHPPGQLFWGCFSYDYHPDTGGVEIHIADRDEFGFGSLSHRRIEARLAELRSMFEHVRLEHPEAERVNGAGTWLLNRVAYRRLFPPEHARYIWVAEPLFSGTGLWGQFLRRGPLLDERAAEVFLERVSRLRDASYVAGCFPLQALSDDCPIFFFYRFYGIAPHYGHDAQETIAHKATATNNPSAAEVPAQSRRQDVSQPTREPEGSSQNHDFVKKMRQFADDYNHEAVALMIAELGDRFKPECPISMEDIHRDYPHYGTLLLQDEALAEFASTYLQELQPFLQAPFPLPNGEVIQGPWLGQYKVGYFTRCGLTAETIEGKRVLDIGSNSGFDTFYLSTLGPREIVGIEPSPLFYYQSLFLWALYRCPNLSFQRLKWQEAKDAGLGTFDVVNCQGILYHEPNPMQLVDALFDLLVPGGMLVLETHISLGDEQTARFIAGPFWGDMSWFWLPTLKTLEAMLRTRGFADIEVRDSFTVDSKNPSDPERTSEGELVGGRAFVTAVKPPGHVYAPKFGLV